MESIEQELFMRVAALQPELAARLTQRLTAALPAAELCALLDSKVALVKAVDQALGQEMSDENIVLTGRDVAGSPEIVRPVAASTDSWLQPHRRGRGASARLTNARAVPEQAASPPINQRGYVARGSRPLIRSNEAAVQALPERPVVERRTLDGPTSERQQLERARLKPMELEQQWTAPVPRGKGRGAAVAQRTAPVTRGKGRGIAICSSKPPCSGTSQEEEEVPDLSHLLQRVASWHPEMGARIVEHIAALGPAAVQDCLGSDSVLQEHINEALVTLFNAEADNSMAGEIVLLREARKKRDAGRTVTGNALARRERPKPKEYAFVEEEEVIVPREQVQPEMAAPAQRLQQLEPQLDTPSTGQAIQSKARIWGLEDFLAELNLSEYLEPVAAWAQTMGAAFLEEIIENQEELVADLQMRPLERKRLQRQGSEVAARLVQLRQHSGRGQAAAAPAVESSASISQFVEAKSADVPPDPVVVPMPTGMWRSSR